MFFMTFAFSNLPCSAQKADKVTQMIETAREFMINSAKGKTWQDKQQEKLEAFNIELFKEFKMQSIKETQKAIRD